MKIGTAALVAATTVVLAGCAASPQHNPLDGAGLSKTQKCNAKKCTLEVEFFLVPYLPGGDNVEMNVDASLVANKDSEVTIVWRLNSSLEFRADSIQFKPETPNSDQFHDPAVLDDDDKPVQKGKKFRWINRNNDGKTYKYMIKLYPKDSDLPFTRDPTIKNQG